MIVVRSCKIALVAAVALFFTLVAVGNVTDYDSNWQFVQHVLSMDTTFPDSKIHWRAITDPDIQQAGYWLIIATQVSTALLLWAGCFRLLIEVGTAGFLPARTPAVVGLTVGLLLYIVGFITIGGEWFAMWQSAIWNGQPKAFAITSMIGVVLVALLLPEETTLPTEK